MLVVDVGILFRIVNIWIVLHAVQEIITIPEQLFRSSRVSLLLNIEN